MALPEIEILPTRDPSEVSFRVPFFAKDLRPSSMPLQYTPYKECRILANAGANLDGFGDYTYGYSQKEGPIFWFYFAKPKTDAEMRVPFNTYETSRQWRWPTVLNNLIFVPDDAFPLSTTYPVIPDASGAGGGVGQVFAATVIERMNITPEALALSRCKVDQFVSNRPWRARDLTHQQPTEGVVSWDFNGAKGSLTCLHPLIRIPARGKEYITVVNGTTVSGEAAPNVPERVFPATNFESWEPFIISDNVERENGVYFRERVTIYPPEMNEPAIL